MVRVGYYILCFVVAFVFRNVYGRDHKTDCQSSCQPNDRQCISRCSISTDPKGANVFLRRKRSSNDFIDMNSIVILEEGDPLPTNLIQPSGTLPPHLAKLFPKQTCLGANPRNNKTTYAGIVRDLQIKCEQEPGSLDQRVAISWMSPEHNADRVERYQIAYSINTDNVFDPLGVQCIRVSNASRGHMFPMVIQRNQSLWVQVLALPAYKGLKEELIRAKCLEEGRDDAPTEVTTSESPPGENPLDWAMIVGSIAGGVCFLLAFLVVAKLLTSHSFGHKLRLSRPHSPQCNRTVDVGHVETYGNTQIAHDAARSGSMLSIDSVELQRRSSLINANAALRSVYISYYPDSAEFKLCVLGLMARLRSHHGIDVVIDELDNRSIDKLGIAGWCNASLTKCDKVMMILSPKYIEALHLIDKDVNSPTVDGKYLRKICLETHHINKRLFVENQRGSSLVLLLAGTNEAELPPFLTGRTVYQWPEAGADSERKLVCCLNDIEDFVV